MRKHLKIIFLSFFILSAAFSDAQHTGTIFGKVSNPDGMPLSFATISVEGHEEFKTSADSSGKFELVIPADSIVTVVVMHATSGKNYREVFVNTGQKKKYNWSFKDIYE